MSENATLLCFCFKMPTCQGTRVNDSRSLISWGGILELAPGRREGHRWLPGRRTFCSLGGSKDPMKMVSGPFSHLHQ